MATADQHHEIISKLDIVAVLKRAGLRFSSTTPNSDGWLECFSIDRDEQKPSAAVNVASQNGLLGRYTDLGDGERSCSLWDALVRLKAFPDWKSARDHYAEQTGVAIPKRGRPKGSKNKSKKPLQERLKPLDEPQGQFTALWAEQWRLAKGGFSREAIQRAGGFAAEWPSRSGYLSIAFPGFEPSDLAKPTAYSMYRATGEDFPAYESLKQRKVHTVGSGINIASSAADLKAATRLWLCEGLTDSLALSDHLPAGHVAISSTAGAGSFKAEFAKLFAGKAGRIVYDRDEAGQSGAAKAAGHIFPLVSEVKVIELPYEFAKSHGKDLRDFFADGHTFAELQEIADATEAFNAEDAAAAAKADPELIDGKPVVLIDFDEERTVKQAIAAIAGRDIYQRGGQLVHAVDDLQPPKGIERPEKSLRITAIEPPVLRTKIASAGYVARRDSEGTIEQQHPPQWLVNAVAFYGRWPEIRYLSGVTDSPLFRPDGSVLQTAGYDPATCIIFSPRIEFQQVPDSPTQEDARAALESLSEIFADFPFVDQAHRSAAMAAALTPAAQHAIDGPSPLFAIDAPSPASGKTLLADVIGVLWTGADMAKTTLPAGDEETRKRITSIALAAEPMILFDNAGYSVGCPSLDAALTARSWSDRILGKSTMTGNLPLDTIFFLTGNNIAFAADTPRRVLLIRLESDSEKPEERSDFRHPDLKSWVLANRGRLVADALTVLRAFHLAGCPAMQLNKWGSFESWSNLVRSAIVWADWPDPCDTRKLIDFGSSVEVNILNLLIAGWQEIDPEGKGSSVSNALKKIVADDSKFPTFRAAIEELTPPGKSPSARSIGKKLSGFRGRICDGKRFSSRPESGISVWKIEEISSGFNGSSGFNSSTLREENKCNSTGDDYLLFSNMEAKAGKPTKPTKPTACDLDHTKPANWKTENGKVFCLKCGKYIARSPAATS